MAIEEMINQVVMQAPTVGILLYIMVKQQSHVDSLIERCLMKKDCQDEKTDVQSS